MPPGRPSSRQRIVQGAVLLAGVVLMLLAVGDEPSRFYLVPGALGLIYLAAALAGGRGGSYWATALVLVGFGSAVVVIERASPGLERDGLELLGAGLGALLGAGLARRGLAVDPVGIAATIAIVGLLAALRTDVGALTDVVFYAALVGLVGLVNLAMGGIALARERPRAEHGRD